MSTLTRELSDLAGQWVIQPSYPLLPVKAGAQLLVAANPLRWALVITPPLTTGGQFYPDQRLAGATGFATGNSLQTLLFSYRDFGGLAQAAWYALNTVGPSSLQFSIIEVLLQQ